MKPTCEQLVGCRSSLVTLDRHNYYRYSNKLVSSGMATMNPQNRDEEYFAIALLHWWDEHGRKNLPWQRSATPYRVWLSEIMLQQTRVETVIDYFNRFWLCFPSLESLAAASLEEVLQLWSGLGYYARARNLHRTAQQLVEHYQGRFPDDVETLCRLPGIGRSTAGAIMALGMDRFAVILDGNVKRVLCRYFAVSGWPGAAAVNRQLWQLATSLTPQQRVGDYTQAVMDLGATVCGRKPRCDRCPLHSGCQALVQEAVTRYPTPKPRRALPTKAVQMLLLLDQHQVLLQQQPTIGLWGGLWILPQIGADQDPVQWCQEQLYMTVCLLDSWPVFRHSFSHYHLLIRPCILSCRRIDAVAEGNYQWLDLDQPAVPAIPAPVQRLLQQLKSHRAMT